MTRLLTACLLAALALPATAADRLDLDTTAIRATRELPKVLYIVPWKNARLGGLVAGAGSSAFAANWVAVDREVFRRQVLYFDLVKGGQARR